MKIQLATVITRYAMKVIEFRLLSMLGRAKPMGKRAPILHRRAHLASIS
jgi:hypothetical protein